MLQNASTFANKNQILASLTEFGARVLIDRAFFQNSSIAPNRFIYLANDLIKILNSEHPDDFSLYKELSIMYKQYFGIELTAEEKKYASHTVHDINILSEIFNGIKYAAGASIFRNLYQSVFSSIAQGLSEHIPAILGANAAAYAGPYILSKVIEQLLEGAELKEEQKSLLRPWLNTVGRLALAFTPRVEATENGITYQYPSASGHTEHYQKIKISVPQAEKRLHNALPDSDTSEYTINDRELTVKLHSIQSLSENNSKMYISDDLGNLSEIQFNLIQENDQYYLSVQCSDKNVEGLCVEYLSTLVTDHLSLQQAISASSVSPLKDNTVSFTDSTFNSMISNSLNAACSIAIPPMILGATSKPSFLISTVMTALMMNKGIASASNTFSVTTENRVLTSASSNYNKMQIGNISVVNLQGTHAEMGMQYGQAMQQELQDVLAILKDFFIVQHGISYSALVERANLFYDRYSYTYQIFLEGMAKGSGLSLDDCKILNGMETLSSLVNTNDLTLCAFLSLPPNRTVANSTLIGRNYDFPAPFDQTANYLTVTILNEADKIPTAFISMPGQIYCPSCLNAKGMFMELNNGMPSGGYYMDEGRESLLINMLEYMQNSEQFSQMDKQLSATESDYSLIINTADAENTKSFEFSSTLGMKLYTPANAPFASTNFYLNDTWQNIPVPTDNTTWMGVTRRNNLLKLASTLEQFDIPSFQDIMSKNISNGGAVWALTIYQIIFDTSNLNLYLKVTNSQDQWTQIPLGKFFNNTNSENSDYSVRSQTSFFRMADNNNNLSARSDKDTQKVQPNDLSNTSN